MVRYYSFRVISRPNRRSAGKALINGNVYHFIKGKWLYCGDCNRRK